MAKTKTPFLSFGSQGSIGGALTSQKRGTSTLLRAKPTPSYRRTLSQQYQRWLYEDYAYLWRQQSEATRRIYAASGTRYHLTAFQYWMKYHLTHLPDIAGIWHLDTLSGGVTPDSSRHANHGSVIGAYTVPGIIDHAFFFDGINDIVNCGNDPSLQITTQITLLTSIYLNGVTAAYMSAISKVASSKGYALFFTTGSRTPVGAFYNGLDWLSAISSSVALDLFKWYRLAYTYDGTTHLIYVKGIQRGSLVRDGGVANTTTDLTLGAGGIGFRSLNGLQDNTIIYNRVLSPAEILRDAERRYP